MSRGGRGNITIYDVATAADVSVATVSRAINDGAEILRGTRERVLRVAQELGYVPNNAARSLVSRRSKAIAAIMTVNSGVYSQILRAVEETATAMDYGMMLVNTYDSPERETRAVRMLASRQVDGVLLVPSEGTHAAIDTLRAEGIPYVLLLRAFDRADADAVTVDNEQFGYMAAQHLLARGHRRIAMVTGSRKISSVRDRIAGYKQAFVDAGLKPQMRDICANGFSPEVAYRAMLRLFAAAAPPSAVFVSNTDQAIAVFRAARELEVSIPDELAVVAGDDVTNDAPPEYAASAYLEVPLTTMNLDYRALGEKGIRILLERLADPDKGTERVSLVPQLVERASSGPLRAPVPERLTTTS
jgi:LacI family transcriptional regulator